MNIILIILLIGFFVLFVFIWWHCRPFHQDTILLITGGVGSGKTSTGLYQGLKSLKSKRLRYNFKKYILRKKNLEKPQLYTNMPLYNVEYKQFTLEHLLREKRFEYDSVIVLNEISLIADSMLAYNIGKDKAREYVNQQLQLFCKLIRHELKSKGISLILDTQNPNDMAKGGDRAITTTTHITKCIKWIPFIRIVKARNLTINIENVSNVNDESEDLSSVDLWRVVPKSIFKKYNSYCYEFLSRDLPIDDNIIKYDKTNLKKKDFYNLRFVVPTLNNYSELDKSNEKLGAKTYWQMKKEIEVENALKQNEIKEMVKNAQQKTL